MLRRWDRKSVRDFTVACAVTLLIPLMVLAAPAIESEIKSAELWANVGTAFGGFAGGGVALAGIYFTWRHQRKKDAAERDERIRLEKEERDRRWGSMTAGTTRKIEQVRAELSSRLDDHSRFHSEITAAVSQCASRDDVHAVAADVRAMSVAFNNFLQNQLARRSAGD